MAGGISLQDLQQFYGNQPPLWRQGPLEGASQRGYGPGISATPPANPIDRMWNTVTDSQWYQGLSPEAKRQFGVGQFAAEVPLSPLRGGYEAGAGAASSDYGRAAWGLLDAVPELGKGLSMAAGAVIPAARKVAGTIDDIVPQTQLVAPSGNVIQAPGAATGTTLPDNRIAQRVPTVKGTDPTTGSTQDLRINTDVMREDPAYWNKVTGARKTDRVDPTTKEPMHEPLHNIIPYNVGTSADPEERAAAAQAIMRSNLERIYQRQTPEVRERSTQWYPGGNKIAGEISNQIGVPRSAAAGSIAALSPQTEWFTNVAQARRLAATYGEDPIITQQMLDRFKAEGSPGLVKVAGILDPHTGRRFSDLDDKEAGIAAVVHDWSRGDRSYPMLAPEGYQTGTQMTGKNVPQNLAWGNTSNLEKSVKALRSGGDQQKISDAMGEMHKVRNFYNNIISPKAGPEGVTQQLINEARQRGEMVPSSQAYDDYTSDTHNVAAALLRPLAGADWDVGVGLGVRGPKSGATGARGLYGMHADVGRDLAKQYGITPYQIQSPTWEGIRALFPDVAKTPANKKAISDIWEEYQTGQMSLSDAQDRIFKYAEDKMGGDVNRTPWR